jgi:hypothetical protein
MMGFPSLPDFSNTVFVGHRRNDVDSICSAIAAADLFNGIAARADDINRETEFVLNYFGLDVPPLASDPAFERLDWCLLDHNQQVRSFSRYPSISVLILKFFFFFFFFRTRCLSESTRITLCALLTITSC